MNIRKATESYEVWLGRLLPLVGADLKVKHAQMREGPFPFLRATFYRWAQVWPAACPRLASGPQVLAVGDLHVENYGTWRDAEGRLIWGVNDFDEACLTSYAGDLVRLAVSASLAIRDSHLGISTDDACRAILDGYTAGLKSGGGPFVLAEDHAFLRRSATGALRDPGSFWEKMRALPEYKGVVPESAAVSLEALMPEPGLPYRLVQRVAGEGSLGRPRLTALASWRGGAVAREAKALAPSACWWAAGAPGPYENLYGVILARAVRCPDPWFRAHGEWLVRRLAPDCSRIELTDLPTGRDDAALLGSMGREAANVHLGTPDAVRAVGRHLGDQKEGWLARAAARMTETVLADWESWKKG